MEADEALEHAHLPALAGHELTRGLGVSAPLIVAGALAGLGAAIHGVGGELLVVRELSPGILPSTRFGGPRMTKNMIHVTWHMTTIAFLTVGCALLLSGSVLTGDTARGIGLVAAGASTGFAALAVGLGGAYRQFPRSLLRPPRSCRAGRHRGSGVVGSSLKKMRVAATAYDLAPAMSGASIAAFGKVPVGWPRGRFGSVGRHSPAAVIRWERWSGMACRSS